MKTLRVLVAEDNEDHRFLTVRALQRSAGVRVEVDAVADGEEMLDYLYRRGAFGDVDRPHVVFLDLRMPRLDGLEVLARVKSDPDLAAIPVVVLSSSDRPEDVDAAYEGGSNAYVTKPRGVTSFERELAAITSYWIERAELPFARR